jgi:hypothetical protein
MRAGGRERLGGTNTTDKKNMLYASSHRARACAAFLPLFFLSWARRAASPIPGRLERRYTRDRIAAFLCQICFSICWTSRGVKNRDLHCWSPGDPPRSPSARPVSHLSWLGSDLEV